MKYIQIVSGKVIAELSYFQDEKIFLGIIEVEGDAPRYIDWYNSVLHFMAGNKDIDFMRGQGCTSKVGIVNGAKLPQSYSNFKITTSHNEYGCIAIINTPICYKRAVCAMK